MRFCLHITLGWAVVAATAVPGWTADSGPALGAVSVVRADRRTGRLVRTVVVSRQPATDSEVHAWIEEAAKNFEISPLLVDSVVQVESNYNPFALSPKGAQGLMQLMPATARRFGVSNPFDPRQNIQGGVRYLKFLESTFQDDRLAVAAYNAGEKAVTKYGGVPPYAETVNYVAKVGKKYSQAERTAAQSTSQAKSAEQPSEDAPRHVSAYVDAEGRLYIATQ